MKKIEYDTNLSSEELIELLKSETGFEENDIIIVQSNFSDETSAINVFNELLVPNKCIAVTYQKPNESFEDSDIYKDLSEKLKVAEDNYAKFPESLIESFGKQKVSSKGCSHCKSSLNKDLYHNKLNQRVENIISENSNDELSFENLPYLERFELKKVVLNCPVCDSEEFIITNTDAKQLKTLQNKITDSNKKINDALVEFQVKSGVSNIGLAVYIEDSSEVSETE